MHLAEGAETNPLVPTGGEGLGAVVGLLILGLIIGAVIAVLRSEHTAAAKAGMLLLCVLVPVIGAVFALLLARHEPDHQRRGAGLNYPASSRAAE
ncbi:PLD nuclease N-terminal domain-containing protein [Nesterenkonia muleiensis]|uniref:PLD nuclease N-terminal domain-containing protein n=1 Tax=Nesterenkonia muleiensis TaxID=2282648 RepID=UPI000E724AC4|nr:PLD nuclease N-terminal domain-containing protein [Nesterenkonia muleiensis]